MIAQAKKKSQRITCCHGSAVCNQSVIGVYICSVWVRDCVLMLNRLSMLLGKTLAGCVCAGVWGCRVTVVRWKIFVCVRMLVPYSYPPLIM